MSEEEILSKLDTVEMHINTLKEELAVTRNEIESTLKIIEGRDKYET